MGRKDAAKANSLPVDRYRKEIGKLFSNSFLVNIFLSLFHSYSSSLPLIPRGT